MACDVYFKSDIANGLKACIILAIKVVLAQGTPNIEHIRGILDLAQAQANLYGLDWKTMLPDIQEQTQLDDGIFALLKDVNG